MEEKIYFSADIDCLKVIVTGSRDDIAPPNLIKQSYPQWNPDAHLEVIVGADHFYGGYTAQLEAVLAAWLDDARAQSSF
jgi:uncharacterized protein